MLEYIASITRFDILSHCDYGLASVIHIINADKTSICIYKFCLIFLYISPSIKLIGNQLHLQKIS